jgi:dolichol-phosphate mannosyltransferase
MTGKISTVVVIPTYNEKENIVPLLQGLLNLSVELKIIVVDDNSPDGTGRIAKEAFSDNPSVSVYIRDGKRGRGLAGIFGFRQALKTDAEIIGEMDGDLSHHPRFIPSMLEKLEDCDVVIGSRYISGGQDVNREFLRRTISRCARMYIRMFLGINVADPTSGFRFFRREILEQVIDELSAEDPFIVTETLFYLKKKKARIVEVPIEFYERKAGVSKLGGKTLLKYLIKVLKLRLNYGR